MGIELAMVQQRIFTSANGAPFVFSLTDPAKDFLLREGTDMKYGARHLERAIDRNLVHPLSNLIATEQVRGGDLLRVDYDTGLCRLSFFKEAEDMPAVSRAIVGWPEPWRPLAIVALFLGGGALLYVTAHPFLTSMVGLATVLAPIVRIRKEELN